MSLVDDGYACGLREAPGLTPWSASGRDARLPLDLLARLYERSDAFLDGGQLVAHDSATAGERVADVSKVVS